MIPAGLRKLLAFGSGVGISIEGPRGEERLVISAVRLRPTGATLTGELTIEGFHQRPAAEWGTEYAMFLSKHGLQQTAAVVMLPRHEVILRQLSLPGVADADLDGAVTFQLDSLHPYDEGNASTSWARLEGSDSVAVAIARRDRVDAYTTLFAEAGIKLAGFTCSGVAIHSALRMLGTAPASPLLAVEPLESGIEIYGESPARPMFSAAFDLAEDESPQRALALAGAELRIEGEAAAAPLGELLKIGPPHSTRAFAAALTAAFPRGTSPLNLLPLEAREVRSPWQWVPTAALGTAVVAAAIALLLLPGYRNSQYLETLNSEIDQITPLATRAAAMDESIRKTRDRAALLDQIRQQSKADMDVMDALTRMLEPPTWLRTMDIAEDQIRVSGETTQASPLLRLIDESALFEGSEFLSPPSRARGQETFSIRARRTPQKSGAKSAPRAAANAQASSPQPGDAQ